MRIPSVNAAAIAADEPGAAGLPWLEVLGRSPANARPRPLAVLDVGTTKTCCLVAHGRPGEPPEILAAGVQSSEGLRAGDVVDAGSV